MKEKMKLKSTRIGLIIDFPIIEKAKRVMYDALNLAFDEALEDGLIDRQIELVVREFGGVLRGGGYSEALKAWKEIAAEGAVGIYGPWCSENALAIRGYIENEGHVPSLAMTGTDGWYGEWCFGINNGSLSEDPRLMTNYLGIQGVKTVAVIYEHSAIGEEFRRFFREACAFDRLEILVEYKIKGSDTDLLPAAKRLKEADADAVAYLGEGIAACYLNKAFDVLDWNPRRVMTSGFMAAPYIPEGIQSIKGWVGCDQYDEENKVGQDFLDRFQRRYGYRPANLFSLMNYDFGNVITHALANSFPVSPEGFKAGLERVKFLPAANGGARGLISFGPYQRRGWLNPDFIILREVDPELPDDTEVVLGGPGTIFRHRFTPRIFGR
ncbi:MAG: ABC transporter substrate-binding protein [Candidatus Latescibacterota bacterium]